MSNVESERKTTPPSARVKRLMIAVGDWFRLEASGSVPYLLMLVGLVLVLVAALF